MNKFLTICILVLIFILCFNSCTKTNISDYQPTFIPLYDENNNSKIAIRSYHLNNDPYFLCVDPNTLQTKTLAAKHAKFRADSHITTSNYFSMKRITKTPYLKLLHHFSQPPYRIQNYGITHAINNVNGMFLTIDMCPSTKVFERRLFLALNALADKLHHPIPIAISISGLWILEHQSEFKWLIKQQSKNKLAITWINHSFSHPYYPDVPLTKNFLLTTPNQFKQEILATEKLLLKYGQTPSVYFRFPGLVSNKNLIMQLKDLGLIAIGSDAWLAKGEQPQNGSVVLIHGNGNEPRGIDKFLLLLQKNKINLLPLIPQNNMGETQAKACGYLPNFIKFF